MIHTTGNSYTFRVENTGTCDPLEFTCITFTFNCVGASNITCTNWPNEALIAPGSFQDVTVTFSTGNEGSGSLTLSASNVGASDQGFVTVPVVVPSGAPRMSVLPYLDAKQDLGRCAASCFAATYAQSTVPYFSLGAPRNVTLVYHGDRLKPRPIVAVDVWPDTTFGSWPSEYQLQVKIDGSLVTFLNGEQTLHFVGSSGSNRYRLAGQFDASSYSNGTVHPMEILVSAVVGGSSYTNRWLTQFLAVDATRSPIAKGWTVAGVQQLFAGLNGGKLITEGDGSATYFKYNSVTASYDTPTGDFSTLKLVGSTWVRAYADSTKLTFNSAGLLVRIQDRWGSRDTLLYDGSNRLTSIKDPLNNAITLAYGANGLSTITDPMGRPTTLTVQADSTLTSIRDPDNLSTTFTYDANKRLQTITARNNKLTTLAYLVLNLKETNKLATITGPNIPIYGGTTANPTTTLSPWQIIGVPYGTTTGSPAPLARVDTVYARVTEPGGAVSKFTVNRWGTPAVTTDAAGRVTTVNYTLAGQPARIVGPGYGTSFDTLAYNGSGLVTFRQAAGGTGTTIVYGGWARATSTSGPGQPTTTRWIGANGRVDSVAVGGTTVERYDNYDGFGRPIRIRRANADTTVYAYYTTGTHKNLNTVTLSGARTTTYRYDSYGRPTARAVPLLPVDSTDYGIMNEVTARRQKTLGGTVVSTIFQADSMLADTTVTDPLGHKYRYRYNALGWLIRQEDPAGKRDTMQYSVDGDLRQVTNRRNLSITRTYDNLHRVTSNAGTSTLTYSYPNDGLQLTASSPVATDTINVNLLGQPTTSITWMAGQRYLRTYHYTSAAFQDSLYVTGGVNLTTRGYGYDTNRGALTSIKLGTATTTIGLGGALEDATRTFPGGDQDQRTFGSLRAPVKLTSTASSIAGTTERWIGYDQTGRIARHLVYGGTGGRSFAFDSLGRFLKAEDSTFSPSSPPPGCADLLVNGVMCNWGAGTWSVVPNTVRGDTFDLVGNRLTNGGAFAPGTNRITAANGCSYITDASGSDSVRTCGSIITNFTWNAEGQLTGLMVTGQPAVTLDYDASGRLVKKTVAGTPSYFLWDGDNLLAELGSTGTTTTAEYSYYTGLDRLHALIKGGTRYYAHEDGLGNMIALTDETSQVRRSFGYDDWGNTTSTSDGASFGNTDRARWKSALWLGPEAELYYMRNRWYEPATGRFISEDPIGLAGGINPLVFAGGNPVDGTDPLGLCLFGLVSIEIRPGIWRCEKAQQLPDVEVSGEETTWPFSTPRDQGWSNNFGNRGSGGPTGFGGPGASDGGGQAATAFTFSAIFPIWWKIAGPAISVAWTPSENMLCLGGGLGVSGGRSFSIGREDVHPNQGKTIRDVLGGVSLSGGYNRYPWLGASGSINGNGWSLGPAMGNIGFSGALTFSGCHIFGGG
jgi:RHS repeat-associated protein